MNRLFTLLVISALTLTGVALLGTQSAQAQTFNILYSFTGQDDGFRPYAGLTLDRSGNLYGTTSGDFPGYGTAFQLKRTDGDWVLNTLYFFGTQPYGRVVFGPNGNLYGTTSLGGGGSDCEYGCGTVFAITTACINCSGAIARILHSFLGGADGVFPTYVDPVFDETGDLYGTTTYGGSANYGVVFQLTPTRGGWIESVIHNFTLDDGAGPQSGVIFDSAGNLYGTTYDGGAYGRGTVFRLARSGSGWAITTLYSFHGTPDGRNPVGGLIIDRSGNLYGSATQGGGSGGGTVFELSPSGGSWTFSLLYSGTRQTGSAPWGNLAMDGAGNLYGAGASWGAFGYGTVFKLTRIGGSWNYTDLHDFTGLQDGANPFGGLTLDPNGNLYGTAANGGTLGVEICDLISSGCGVVWEITP